MDTPLLILRVLHLLAGTFWVGAVLVTVLFLFKAFGDAGPAGGQVMGALIRRRYLDVVPAAALVTVLSGIDLLRRASSGFAPEWFGSRAGIAYSVGAVAALIGLALGLAIGRPSTLKAAALGRDAAALPDGPEKGARMAEVATLRARGQGALKVTAVFLTIALLCMAVARYL